MDEEKHQIFWHIKVENSIRYFHPSYRQLTKAEIKQVPAQFWQPDPVHLKKL